MQMPLTFCSLDFPLCAFVSLREVSPSLFFLIPTPYHLIPNPYSLPREVCKIDPVWYTVKQEMNR